MKRIYNLFLPSHTDKNMNLLNTILTDSTSQTASTAESVRTICVFDLDSTLFNVSPRTEQILREFSQQHQIQHFSQIKVHPKDWGLKEILIREGYDISEKYSENIELHRKLVPFWTEKFFTNEYLNYDTPYLGAVNFVQTLYEKNIDIHYLTGRDVFRMGPGTKEVLLKWGFPILSEGHLHLKPHKDMDDHKYKLDWVLDFKKTHPENKIYFFENEPVNINAIGKNIQEQNVKNFHIVYLNTTHSRKETVTVPVIEIDHFSLETSA
jgi:hypothetical protein